MQYETGNVLSVIRVMTTQGRPPNAFKQTFFIINLVKRMCEETLMSSDEFLATCRRVFADAQS
jgi:hypothetical protein